MESPSWASGATATTAEDSGFGSMSGASEDADGESEDPETS